MWHQEPQPAAWKPQALHHEPWTANDLRPHSGETMLYSLCDENRCCYCLPRLPRTKKELALIRAAPCVRHKKNRLIFIKRSFGVFNYSIIAVTVPEPTVLPPSRIANFSPTSIAIGVMSLIVISIWSPGMHISTPSGSSATPVTSVVLK